MSSEGCLRLSSSNIIKFLQDISLHNKYANEHQSCLPDIFNIIAEILHCAKMLSVICCRSPQIFLKVPLRLSAAMLAVARDRPCQLADNIFV